MSESQAFFLLSVLCDRLLPGYYSTTMYGTLLDQRVFESLVEKTMPILWDHLVRSDVQLSVVSLPWFLSLYINSMPLVFAFRVLDVFFLEGPKVLFQVGLAILRINGEELLDVTDDGSFISVLKNYFSRLDESAHARSENEKLRAVTKFQELMVVAFKEFAGITQATILEQREKHKEAVLDSIENFAKRTSIRNLGPDSKRLSLDDLGFLYDRFFNILYEREQRMKLLREESDKRSKLGRNKAIELIQGPASDGGPEIGRVGLGPSPTLMNYDGFREFLAGIAKWAISDSPRTPLRDSTSETNTHLGGGSRNRAHSVSFWGDGNPDPADHDFMQRLYGRWNKDDNDGLSLQNVVSGLAHIKGTRDIMTSISYFFDLYDDDQDGRVDREGILRISEALLFLTRRGVGGSLTPYPLSPMSSISESNLDDSQVVDGANGLSIDEKFLSSISAFIRRCFEYADPDHPQNQDHTINNDASKLEESMDKFSIGEDDEDLLDLSDAKETTEAIDVTTDSTMIESTSNAKSNSQPSSSPLIQPKSLSQRSANLALDPANPLHITLPTFRMVILADELLQQFFEFSFPESFGLAPSSRSLTHVPSNTSLRSNTITTFSSITSTPRAPAIATHPTTGVVPPGKGLRGVLDNIVSDGMRVAAEVRKRMDEAQKEMEKNALAHGGRSQEDDDDEEDDDRGTHGGDRDLLEGAEVGSIRGMDEGVVPTEEPHVGDVSSVGEAMEKAEEKVVEFER